MKYLEFVIIMAFGIGLIAQHWKIQKLRALRRIDRAKYKEAQLTKGQHDRASLHVTEQLRRRISLQEDALRKERQTKQCFKRACEKLKVKLDDALDEIDSLRSALISANRTIRAMNNGGDSDDDR